MGVNEGGKIVVLTGAGISAESGLATFRGTGGLWEGHRFEDVATPGAFARDPIMVHRFYNMRRRQLREESVQPNAAHQALARLEREWPGEVLVITQNVDDLHERAGSSRIIHMHGELTRCRCGQCRSEFQWIEDVTIGTPCPSCGAAGGVRPAIVWFGEMPIEMEAIEEALLDCDLFAAIGTSGLVYPAAGFVALVNAAGRAHTVEINLEASAARDDFVEHRAGAASQLVPQWVDALLAG